MRVPVLGCLALAFGASCGSSRSVSPSTDGGSGRTGPTQVNLKITTAGNGLVRGAGADCRGSCSAQYASNAQVHLVAVPDAGASFLAWSGACGGAGACDLTLDADREVSATFTTVQPPAQVNLKITTAGNGVVRGAGADCRGSCSAPHASGAQVHLVAVPDPGASFAAWSGACSGAGACDLTLNADQEVSATFAALPPPPPRQHRLNVIVQGNGRVTSSPGGLDCDSSTCAADFAAGTSVSLTAIAGSGFSFTGWSMDCSGAGDCTVALTKDATVSASFVSQPPPPPPQVHLSVSTSGPGTVTGGGLDCGQSSSTCDVMVAKGSSVTLTAAAAGGAQFAGWGGACSGMSATCQLTLQSDTAVSAEFQPVALVLAPDDGTNDEAIALNSTRVFWPRDINGSGRSIWSISKNGGDAVRVANAPSASALVADDGNLYWTEFYNVYSAPAGGGQPTLLFTGFPIGKLALDESGAVYWTVGECCSGANSGSVHRMQNGTHTVLAEGQNPIGPVAVDASHLYFMAFDGHAGSIQRVPRNGGAVDTVLSCGSGCYPQALAVDPQNVYFRVAVAGSPTIDEHVQVMSKADLRVRVLSAGNGAGQTPPYGFILDLDVHASVAYWNWADGASPYGVFRSNADGSGFAAVDSGSDEYWAGVRADDVAVYYWHQGAIIRRLK